MQQQALLEEIMAGLRANPSRDRFFVKPKRVVRLPLPARVWVAPTECFVKLRKDQAVWPRLVEELKVFVMMRFNSITVWVESCLRAVVIILVSAFLVVVMGILQLQSICVYG